MQSIDETTVKHIANLSKLELTDADVARYTPQLEAILEYASHLPEVTTHPQIETFLRVDDDVALERHNPHDLLKNAVALEDGYVKVPAILDRSES
jgi:aspartyl-tRNA(Asn)/glutamyl-tRNA(Gln) amidotransferase subunit C